jgi:N4-gp56 family major capsid protein
MADTTVLTGLELTKWRKTFINEYLRDSGFKPYMGTSEMDIIHTVNDLQTDGVTIRIPLLARLKGAGVEGDTRLTGAEEALDQYYQDITWKYKRHAVTATKNQKKRSAVDFMAQARPRLKDWASEKTKFEIVDCFHKMSDGTNYADASAGTRNTWVTNNADRVLFGASTSNYSTTHATGLGNVDSTSDKLTTATASLARFLARQAEPKIRPFKTGTNGREYYVMFCHPICFRDLKTDTAMVNANRDARSREGNGMDSNPIFQDGDLIYDGIIFREIPEFYSNRIGTGRNPSTHLTGVGASTIDVGVNFLCGAQAIGMVNKQAAIPTSKNEDDYGFVDGVGIEAAWGMDKLRWNNGSGTNKDHGIVTVYCSAAA